MRYIAFIIIFIMTVSCTINRTLSKYQSGEEFNSLAENKDAKVKLVGGEVIPVKNISYDGEIFRFNLDSLTKGSLQVDSVANIDIYKAKRVMTALKYLGTGVVVSILSGITAMFIADSDEKIWAEKTIALGFLCTAGFTVKGAVRGVEAHFKIVNWKK
ncbi:MAG TPA: hypothetical protein PLU43_11885 [Lachnospiraceae bacterium]|nr:hypothetical protein [Lachnospiraceae bacterium]